MTNTHCLPFWRPQTSTTSLELFTSILSTPSFAHHQASSPVVPLAIMASPTPPPRHSDWTGGTLTPVSPPEKAESALPSPPSSHAHNTDPAALEKELRRITTAKDWDGPDDPGNPHNWTLSRKWFQTLTTGCISLTAACATSIFAPAIDDVAAEFSVSTEVATLTYSIYSLGLALGGPVFSPLSESIGRRPVFCLTMPIFGLFTLGVGFAPNIGALLALRFLAGCAGSVGFSTGSGTIADIWPPKQRSIPLTFYGATAFFGPATGPLLGAAVTTTRGWRWTSWVLLFMLVLLVLLPLCFYKESYKRVILQRRAKQLRLRAEEPVDSRTARTCMRKVGEWCRRSLTRPLHMYLTEPIVFSQNTFVAFNFALLYAFFAAFPVVFADSYGFGSLSTGLTFLALGVGVFAATAIIIAFNRLYYLPRLQSAVAADAPVPEHCSSRLAPETRLLVGMIGGPCITGSLFLFGWTAAYRVHWIVPTIAEGFFSAGVMLVFMGSIMYLTDTYGPRYTASANASQSLLRYLLGAAFPLFAVQMFHGLGTQWACTLLGGLSLLLMMVPYVLVRAGPGFRRRSGYRALS